MQLMKLAELNLNNVLPQFQNFVGQKIYLANGDKSSKFNITMLNEQPNKFENEYASLQNCYIRKSYHSIYLQISCCFKNTDSTCFYEELSIWVGDLNDGGQVLTQIRTEPYPFKTYDIKEIQTLLKRKEELEKELSSVNSKLNMFKDFR